MLKFSISLATFVSYSRLYLYHFRDCTCTHCMTVPEQFYWLNLYPTNIIQLTLTYPFRGCTWTIFLTLPVPFPWLYLYHSLDFSFTLFVAELVPFPWLYLYRPFWVCIPFQFVSWTLQFLDHAGDCQTHSRQF